jgi:hypothetical protein
MGSPTAIAVTASTKQAKFRELRPQDYRMAPLLWHTEHDAERLARAKIKALVLW